MCQWGRPWAAALTLGNKAPPTQPGFQFRQEANTIMQIICLAHAPPPRPGAVAVLHMHSSR